MEKLLTTKYVVGNMGIIAGKEVFNAQFKADTLEEVKEARKELESIGLSKIKVLVVKTYELK